MKSCSSESALNTLVEEHWRPVSKSYMHFFFLQKINVLQTDPFIPTSLAFISSGSTLNNRVHDRPNVTAPEDLKIWLQEWYRSFHFPSRSEE